MKKTFSLLLAAAACVIPFTLSSCGGGGSGDDSFTVSAKAFASGAKGFAIQSNSGWEFWSDNVAGDYIHGDTAPAGTIIVNGYMKYGFNGNQPILYGVMRYFYDAESNVGTLKYSMDATNSGNNAGTETAATVTEMINTIHGEEIADDIDMSTHFRHTTIIFDFNTGTCSWTCGCGHVSQTMDFLIRSRH